MRFRRGFAASLLLVFGFGAIGVAASLTDSDIHVPPGYYTMQPPGAGGTYVDPVFGTSIKRVSDATQLSGPVGIVPVYSQSSMFNLNDTYMSLVATMDGSRHLYDGDGTYIRSLNEVQSEPRWSRINPNHLYFRTSRQIRRLDVATGNVATIASFGENISFGRGTGDVSDNERIVVLRDSRYISVWDLANGVQVSIQELDTFQSPINGSGIDYVTITKGGDSFVVGYNAGGDGRGQGIEQYDVDGNFMTKIWKWAAHAAMGRDVDGTPVYFIANSRSGIGCDNGVVKISLDGGAAWTCLKPLDWSIAYHLSAHGNDGWVYLSTYQAQATPVAAAYPGEENDWSKWHPYTNEIFRVRADGTVVERLAHHRSSVAVYWTQPHASISISGNKLVYGSDFRLDVQTHYADTYLIDLTAHTETVPVAPSTLQSTGFPDPRVDLSWTDNSNNEDAFEVLRQGPGESFYRFIAYLGADTTSYQDFGVIAGDLYCYQVVAHNGVAASVPSNSSCATPTSAPAPPTAPTDLQSEGFSDPRVDLSWADNSLEETSFEVRRQGPGETYYSPIATIAANVTSYPDTSVSSDVQYCYQVIAWNSVGESGPTGISCATPPATAPTPPPAPTLPPAPTSLSVEWSGKRRVTLSWVDNAENEARFLIYRRAGNRKYRRIGQVGVDITMFTDTRVRSNRSYCYRVLATNDAGRSVSNEACIGR